MYANLLENRNKSISELIKLGRCIGRSLRENVKLFSVDSENSMVSYLTESDHIIEGNYDTENGVTLSNIVITSTESMKNDDLYEEHVNQQIGSFVGDLLGDNRNDASISFDKILNLWENKVRLINEEDKIKKESDRNKTNTSIIKTSEFSKLVEVSPNLVEFLSENKQDIVENTNILEYLAFSNVISKAFDIPRLTLEMLGETAEYSLKDTITSPIFDVICKQELLKQEIYESKREFSTMWVNNPHIQKIVSNIFEQDREELYGTIIEAVTEIPYFALATKKQLVNLFINSLSMNEVVISEEDIKRYVSEIYEINKPIKEGIVEALSEKYGINIKKLDEIPSFRMIIENQLSLLEELCSMMDENSNLHSVLQETARMLKNKNGVESIDINDYIQYLFEEAEYTDVLTEKQLTKHIKVDFKKIAKDVGNLADTFSALKAKVGQQYDSNEGQEDEESSEKAETKAPSDGKAKEAKKTEKEPETPPEEAPEEQPDETDPAAADAPEKAEAPKTKKELNKSLQAMEDLISDLAAEFGAEDPTGMPDDGTDDEGSTNR